MERVVKEEKFPNTRKPSHRWVCGEFWNLRGQHNQEDLKQTNKKTPTEYVPNHNSQQKSRPDTPACQQWAGAEEGGAGSMLRVRTEPECPEDNLRELMWDSNLNCEISREREKKKKRERKNFPAKSSKLKHCQACSQNKGLSRYQRRAYWLRTGPCPRWRQRGRQVAARVGRRGPILVSEMAPFTKLPAGSQLLTKSSWDPGWLTPTRRASVRNQLPRGDTRHT